MHVSVQDAVVLTYPHAQLVRDRAGPSGAHRLTVRAVYNQNSGLSFITHTKLALSVILMIDLKSAWSN